MVHWFRGSFPDGCLGDEVLTGALSLGAHLGGPRRGCHRPLLRCSVIFYCLKGRIQTEACVIPNYTRDVNPVAVT